MQSLQSCILHLALVRSVHAKQTPVFSAQSSGNKHAEQVAVDCSRSLQYWHVPVACTGKTNCDCTPWHTCSARRIGTTIWNGVMCAPTKKFFSFTTSYDSGLQKTHSPSIFHNVKMGDRWGVVKIKFNNVPENCTVSSVSTPMCRRREHRSHCVPKTIVG